MPTSIVAIYDFEVFPFALGDVLTWNVRTAMRCEELGRSEVDIYICADERYPAWIHQREMVNAQNFDLFFTELYSAFGTHPYLGNIHIFRNRQDLVGHLRKVAHDDPVNLEAIDDYLKILRYTEVNSIQNRFKRRIITKLRKFNIIRRVFNGGIPSSVKSAIRATLLPNDELINNYLIKYIASHEPINAFAVARGRIPFLKEPLGCSPDIDELINTRFQGKKLVPFHLRLRRLDAGYGGTHSYARDSDFLEWYDFLREAADRYPDIQFIALGRLQEKPLALLGLPNVTSLRVFGLGLGHELTLMHRSDLFIGASSGFAAFANFTKLPYFVTRMNAGVCQNYAIKDGSIRLPFAGENQRLVYENETSEMLMALLKSHFGNLPAVVDGQQTRLVNDKSLDVRGWINQHLNLKNSAATTCRFFDSDIYRQEETAYLLFLNLEKARSALLEDRSGAARAILHKMIKNFGDICTLIPEYSELSALIDAKERGSDDAHLRAREIDLQVSAFVGSTDLTKISKIAGWRPASWILSGISRPLPNEPQPALSLRPENPGSNFRVEGFVADNPVGKIYLCFEARREVTSATYPVHIAENGVHRPVGEFFVDTHWRTYEIPVVTIPQSRLAVQVDLSNDKELLLIRNFYIVGGASVHHYYIEEGQTEIALDGWVGEPGTIITDSIGQIYREWNVAGRRGYVQTPELPRTGLGTLLVSFEVKVDRPALSFTSVYLFEGKHYRKLGEYAFSSVWEAVFIMCESSSADPLKIQIDYPEGVDALAIRNCRVVHLSIPSRLSKNSVGVF